MRLYNASSCTPSLTTASAKKKWSVAQSFVPPSPKELNDASPAKSLVEKPETEGSVAAATSKQGLQWLSPIETASTENSESVEDSTAATHVEPQVKTHSQTPFRFDIDVVESQRQQFQTEKDPNQADDNQSSKTSSSTISSWSNFPEERADNLSPRRDELISRDEASSPGYSEYQHKGVEPRLLTQNHRESDGTGSGLSSWAAHRAHLYQRFAQINVPIGGTTCRKRLPPSTNMAATSGSSDKQPSDQKDLIQQCERENQEDKTKLLPSTHCYFQVNSDNRDIEGGRKDDLRRKGSSSPLGTKANKNTSLQTPPASSKKEEGTSIAGKCSRSLSPKETELENPTNKEKKKGLSAHHGVIPPPPQKKLIAHYEENTSEKSSSPSPTGLSAILEQSINKTSSPEIKSVEGGLQHQKYDSTPKLDMEDLKVDKNDKPYPNRETNQGGEDLRCPPERRVASNSHSYGQPSRQGQVQGYITPCKSLGVEVKSIENRVIVEEKAQVTPSGHSLKSQQKVSLGAHLKVGGGDRGISRLRQKYCSKDRVETSSDDEQESDECAASPWPTLSRTKTRSHSTSESESESDTEELIRTQRSWSLSPWVGATEVTSPMIHNAQGIRQEKQKLHIQKKTLQVNGNSPGSVRKGQGDRINMYKVDQVQKTSSDQEGSNQKKFVKKQPVGFSDQEGSSQKKFVKKQPDCFSTGQDKENKANGKSSMKQSMKDWADLSSSDLPSPCQVDYSPVSKASPFWSSNRPSQGSGLTTPSSTFSTTFSPSNIALFPKLTPPKSSNVIPFEKENEPKQTRKRESWLDETASWEVFSDNFRRFVRAIELPSPFDHIDMVTMSERVPKPIESQNPKEKRLQVGAREQVKEPVVFSLTREKNASAKDMDGLPHEVTGFFEKHYTRACEEMEIDKRLTNDGTQSESKAEETMESDTIVLMMFKPKGGSRGKALTALVRRGDGKWFECDD